MRAAAQAGRLPARNARQGVPDVFTKTISAVLAASMLVSNAWAADPKPDSAADAEKEAPEAAPQPRSQSTQHELHLGGQILKYTATEGWLILSDSKPDKDGKVGEPKPVARFGYTAYTLDGVKDPSRRPITFAFNGGPGSASIWLHMGVLGPRRVDAGDASYAPPPPARVVDNEYTILDASDLVMIDPVGTGFSKPLGDAKGEDFWGVDQDVDSVGDFIRRYVTDNGRWGSPKYVLGESYGGVRGSGLARHLQSDLGMNLNGLILVSPYFGQGSGNDGIGMDLPHALYLSTFAATAWHYDLIPGKPASLADYSAEVERFAREEYMPALFEGYAISPERKQAVAAKLGQYTGTSADFWMKADLRASHIQFLQELLRNRGLIAGRIDSRYSGPSLNPLNDEMDYDPFFPAIGPAYMAGFREYLHSELKFDVPDEYVVSAGLYRKWDWSHKQPGVAGGDDGKQPVTNMLPDLQLALTTNPALQLLVEQGRFDLATPAYALKYNMDHLRLPPGGRERIHVNFHDAGHMMYLNADAARQFRENVVGFIRETDRL